MRTAGRQPSTKSRKQTKGIVAESLKKKTSVKVIDVALGSAKGAARAAAKPAVKTTAKPQAGRQNVISRKAAGKEVKTKRSAEHASKRTAAKPVLAKPALTKPTLSKAAEPRGLKTKQAAPARIGKAASPLASAVEKTVEKSPEKITEDVVQPGAAVLRSFRNAAKQNRKLLRDRLRQQNKSAGFLAKPPKKGKKYLFDLRVHSPGTEGYLAAGGVDPAAAIVRLARVKGLALLGLSDYYTALNVDKVKELAQGSSVTVIPGFDFCCRVGGCDEVHFTALFPEATTGAELFELLNVLRVPPAGYGKSSYCIALPFEEVLRLIEEKGGLVIPSRVDRTPYSELAIPLLVTRFGFHTFDLVYPDNPEFFRQRWPHGAFSFYSFSGANSLGQIGNRSMKIKLTAPNFAALKELFQRRPV